MTFPKKDRYFYWFTPRRRKDIFWYSPRRRKSNPLQERERSLLILSKKEKRSTPFSANPTKKKQDGIFRWVFFLSTSLSIKLNTRINYFLHIGHASFFSKLSQVTESIKFQKKKRRISAKKKKERKLRVVLTKERIYTWWQVLPCSES